MTKSEGNQHADGRKPEVEKSRSGTLHASFLRVSGFGLRHFLAVTACAALAQQAPPPPPDEEDVPEVEEEWDFTKGRGHDLTLLDKLVPGGQSHEGLRYPVYSEPGDGKPPVLKSQFESKLVTRTDATHLQFKDAVVSMFGDARYPDIATRMVSLLDAIYDLKNDILISNSPVQVLSQDMTIRGGSVLYDPVTGITVFSKGVKFYTHRNEPAKPANNNNTPAPTPQPAPAPAPQPASPPPSSGQ